MAELKLNIGCGGVKMPGYINLDIHPAADVVFDLERCGKGKDHLLHEQQMPFPENHFDSMLMSHVFEHIHNVLPMMQELWRVAKPGCRLHIYTPYGSSDNAWEDPTHVRAVYANSFTYFSQAWYGRNDYGYRGDWDVALQQFVVLPENRNDAMMGCIETLRNMVDELRVCLIAVKPMRTPGFTPTPFKQEIKVRA